MSKLQTALHAFPPGSVVTKEMVASNKEVGEALDTVILEEVCAAKRHQEETGCLWDEAIRATSPQQSPCSGA